jgi:hypothetical protein
VIILETPAYIKSLLIHNGKRQVGRKAWSIDIEQVWLPFFTATNAVGDTALPFDVLGCPIRLAHEQDGSVKFSKTGRPVTRVAKELAEGVRMVRDNFVGGLVAYAEAVAQQSPDAYNKVADKARKAGEPIARRDASDLAIAQKARIAEEVTEATKGRSVSEKERELAKVS